MATSCRRTSQGHSLAKVGQYWSIKTKQMKDLTWFALLAIIVAGVTIGNVVSMRIEDYMLIKEAQKNG